ncbi:hypothetical protein [Thermosporothrix hazakensis]|uniref:hypothetical protein n=1 Tax=Thermosporothrix hazakensis TaxID=644383 RepID=UPI0010EC5214|nr:hypothetical protein [Thermosporothrix hazakensis]GCE50723.1 hypothetical protein KTH_55920 [Thermosporothrix hazakensis]
MRLRRAVASRAYEQATLEFEADWQDVFAHNIRFIRQPHKERINAIKRDGARLRAFTCIPFAIFFGGSPANCFYTSNWPGGLI